MKQSVFFAPEGAKGLNETSATKLAAIASNLKTKAEAVLNNASFLNVKVAIVGSGEQLDYGTGMSADKLTSLADTCHRIGEYNGFISWLREAQKALEENRRAVSRLTMDDWAKATGTTIPKCPDFSATVSPVSLNDIIEEMSVKERAEYLALEAKSAQMGKFIHPDGPFDNARNELHKRINAKHKADGKGRDMLIYSYSPSVSTIDVDEVFEKIQRQYQNYESSLNHIKSDLRKKLDKRNSEINAQIALELREFKEKRAAYDQQMRELTVQYSQWLQDKVAEAAKVKIAIPECYEELLKELYNVGK